MKSKQKAAFIENLKGTRGMVLKACKLTGLSTSAYYRALQKDPKFKKDVDTVTKGVNEHVENKLFENIDKGNVTAQIFYLKTHDPAYRQTSDINIKQETLTLKVKQVDLKQVDAYIEKTFKLENTTKLAEPQKDSR